MENAYGILYILVFDRVVTCTIMERERERREREREREREIKVQSVKHTCTRKERGHYVE